MEQHLFGKNNENPNIINRFMVDKTLNCNNQKVLDMKTRAHTKMPMDVIFSYLKIVLSPQSSIFVFICLVLIYHRQPFADLELELKFNSIIIIEWFECILQSYVHEGSANHCCRRLNIFYTSFAYIQTLADEFGVKSSGLSLWEKWIHFKPQ